MAMDFLEFVIILAVIAVILYIAYYFLHGSTGAISLSRPVESRVDEYLDRRFQSILEEYQLVTQTRFQGFREKNEKELSSDESRIAGLKKFQTDALETLRSMEGRLDAVEKELDQKRAGKK